YEAAVALLVIQRAAAGCLGAVPPHHLILLGGEQTAPLLVRAGDRKPFRFHGSQLLNSLRRPGRWPLFRPSQEFAVRYQVDLAPMRSDRLALEQLDRNALRRAQEGDPHARPHRGGFLGELDALAFELGNDGVDATDREPEVIKALIRRRRWRID